MKKTTMAAIGIALVAALSGCEQPVVTSSERITVEVVAVHLKSKSNSKVDLRRKDGYVYREKRLSCSKSRARNVRIGSKWDIIEEYYTRDGEQYMRLVGTSGICSGSN